MIKNLPAMRGTWVWSLGWEDSLEEGMATHSSILAWRSPIGKGAWQGLQSMGLQRVRHDWVTKHTHMHHNMHHSIIFNGQDMEMTQISTKRWMDKEDAIYKNIYIHNWLLLIRKKNEILPFMITWMELVDVPWNKTETDKYCMISPTCEI